MVERRFKTDICELDASKVTSYNHDIHGPVTVFKDVVISRAIVHPYEDGMAYKPGRELEAGYWTRWYVGDLRWTPERSRHLHQR